MADVDVRLTKQHLSTKVFKTYFKYLTAFHPEMNLKEICQEAGLSFEYFQNEDNWVSVTFDKRFVEIIKSKVHDKDFEFKVGQYSMTKEALGPTLFALGKNALSISYIYKNSWKLSKFLNRIVSFELVDVKNGSLQIRARAIDDGMSEDEKDALAYILPYMMENVAGYYSAIPLLKGEKAARIEFQPIENNEYIISAVYQPEKNSKIIPYLANFGILLFGGIHGIQEKFSSFWFACIVLAFGAVNLTLSWAYIKKIRSVVSETESNLSKIDEQYKSLVETKIALQARLRESEAINQITNRLIRTTSEEEILNSACYDLAKILEFDRAVFLLADKEKKFLEFKGGYLNDTSLFEQMRAIRFEIALATEDPTKISNIYRYGKSILIEDVASHLLSLNKESQEILKRSQSKSFICVPVMTEHKSIGVLLVDNYLSKRMLTVEDEKLLNMVGRQVAIALEKQKAQTEAVEAFMEMDKMAKSYSRFVPWETINLLGFNSVLDVDIRAGKELQMAIVFCDIRGFTTMSETMSPSDSIAFLNSYFENLAPVLQKHNGIIDKFLGDGIMALFLSPQDAVDAMTAFQKKLDEYNLKIRDAQAISVKAGMGLHYGKVLFGAIGFEQRLSISVVSDAVNLASRLDGLTKKFNVDCVCTDEVINRMEDKNGIRLIAQLRVEGRASLTNVYEVFRHLSEQEFSIRNTNAGTIHKVVQAIGNDKLQYAREYLKEIAEVGKSDPVVEYYSRFLSEASKASAA